MYLRTNNNATDHREYSHIESNDPYIKLHDMDCNCNNHDDNTNNINDNIKKDDGNDTESKMNDSAFLSKIHWTLLSYPGA